MFFLKGWDLLHIRDKRISSFESYQRLLLDDQFWKSLSAKKILLFQSDSEILRHGIEDYLDTEYSFIGAPWTIGAPWGTLDRRGGNGGISIRDVDQHISLLEKNPLSAIVQNHETQLKKNGIDKPLGKGLSEDVWFSHNLPNVAPYEICRGFSVESEFALGTVCAHAIDRHLAKSECLKIRNQYKKLFS